MGPPRPRGGGLVYDRALVPYHPVMPHGARGWQQLWWLLLLLGQLYELLRGRLLGEVLQVGLLHELL